ncbi:MAG: hypothetical protein O7F17_04830 [Planctomycetota bacterium]|nr:hypothetical protein [Planctomycetota bacterium]
MTSNFNRSFGRKPFSPRVVRNGIRLRATGDEAIARTWISQQWLERLEDLVSVGPLREGLEYARRGQTITLQINPGRVDGHVQGRAAEPYRTQLRIPTLDEQQWQRIIDAMAGEAFYSAMLLANQLPPAVGSLFASLELQLVPSADQLTVECDCPASEPCKHAAAVGYLLAERIDNDPLVMLSLRGMPGERVLERLAQARAMRTHGVAAAYADPPMPHSQDGAVPLEACLDAFWRSGGQLAQLKRLGPPQHAPHALLRRLGPTPLPGQFPMLGLLASIYDAVSRSAIRLRDEAERIDDESA